MIEGAPKWSDLGDIEDRHSRGEGGNGRGKRSKQRSYSITSSARARSVGGMVMPIMEAAFRLMISSSLSETPPAGRPD
jgi:hypothetical protein